MDSKLPSPLKIPVKEASTEKVVKRSRGKFNSDPGIGRVPVKKSLSLEDVESVDAYLEESDCDVLPDSPDLRTNSPKHSHMRFADRSQTLVFLDWDDTLFPTTELIDNWGIPSRFEYWEDAKLTHEQEESLDRWRSVLLLYLKNVCAVADRCVIITNARRPWVSKCIERFAPNLEPLFNRHKDLLHIVYARDRRVSKTECLCPGSPRGNPVSHVDKEILQEDQQQELTRAKLLAMRQEAKKYYNQYPGQTWKNVLSVGDSRYEHDAAWEMAFRRKAPKKEKLRLKTIVTPTSPGIKDLTYRLGFARLMYPAYVKFDGDFDIDMNLPGQLATIADVLGMPELKEHIRPMPLSEHDDEDHLVAHELEEVEFVVHEHVARQVSRQISASFSNAPSRQMSTMSNSSGSQKAMPRTY